MRIVAKLREIAEEKGITPAQLALAWVLAQGDDIVPIPGTKRRKYLEENAAAADVELTDEELVADRAGAARGRWGALRGDRNGRGEPLMPGAAASLITTPFGAESTAAEVVEGDRPQPASGRSSPAPPPASGRDRPRTGRRWSRGHPRGPQDGDGETVAADIRSTTGNDEVTVAPLELTDRASIDAFVDGAGTGHSTSWSTTQE